MSRAVPLVALATLGCASVDLGTAARRDSAEALRCPRAEVELTQLGEYRYRARGCGRTVTVACTAAALEPRCLPEGRGGGEAEAPPRDVEDTIRAGLDARRDDVLACVGRERVGVRVAWVEDGTLTLALQGDLAGSPEEECVRRALHGVRVRAGRGEGVVIHLVD